MSHARSEYEDFKTLAPDAYDSVLALSKIAAKAGIESGDVITAVNGTPVKDSRDLARKIGMMAPDTPDSAIRPAIR